MTQLRISATSVQDITAYVVIKIILILGELCGCAGYTPISDLDSGRIKGC